MMIKYFSIEDAGALRDLYYTVSKYSGTLARLPDECELEYFESILDKSSKSGINLAAYDGNELIGFVYAFKFEPKVFDHALANMTIAIHPDYQGQGIGKKLLENFMLEVNKMESISRVELFTPCINKSAIKLYESFGFVKEGVFKDRAMFQGRLIDDIAMACLIERNSKFR